MSCVARFWQEVNSMNNIPDSISYTKNARRKLLQGKNMNRKYRACVNGEYAETFAVSSLRARRNFVQRYRQFAGSIDIRQLQVEIDGHWVTAD